MRDRKILAVTSAVSREGKTNVAVQLAISVASATNRPTLLIDGDMRSPDIHRIFEIERSPGLCEVLKGKYTCEEAIDKYADVTLHVLTAGVLDCSPHRLVGNVTFPNLIEKLRQTYDYIIIDTPPILAASEALLIANVADAAIICARRDFSRIDQVVNAFSRLQSAGVNTVGAVLNGIPQYAYAYRYGSYYYERHQHSDGSSTGSGADALSPSANQT
jgi:capsular exopolysaccharide synthesis family protein